MQYHKQGSPIKRIIQKVANNHFVRSVGVLAGGSALSQGIVFLAMPVLTRLYSPDAFSVMAVYVGLLSVISPVACLRFEIAIPLPKDDRDGVALLVLSLVSSAVLSGCIAVILVFFAVPICKLLNQPRLLSYIWMLPFGIWFLSSYNALQYWATRKHLFGMVARTRLERAVAGVGAQVALGFMKMVPGGLIAGKTINSGAGILGLTRCVIKQEKGVWGTLDKTVFKRVFAAYDRFPKYSTFESFFNSAAIQFPVILIAAIAIGPEAGYLSLAMMVMQAPMGLIGGSISQVYLSQASTEYRSGNIGPFTTKIIGNLVKLGVGPILFIGIIAPCFFSIIFGSEWYRAGVLVRWMTPWFVLQFLSSPISMALHVAGQQRRALLLQMSGLFIRVGLVAFAGAVATKHVSEIYALSGIIFYFIYLWLIIVSVGCSCKRLVVQLFQSVPILLAWVVLGMVFCMIINISI